MQIGRIENATRVLGKSQGYLALPVRDQTTTAPGLEPIHEMVSAWLPTPKELEALNAGAPVHLRVQGTGHPPVLVEVGEPPG